MIDDQPPVPEAAQTSAVRPRLWNPNAAANWSLLFSPIFGALLHAANWRALGKPERATPDIVWAWAGVAFLALNLASLALPESATSNKVLQFGGIGLLVGWYFGQGRAQAKYVKETYGDEYDRRGWGRPLLGAVACSLAYFAAAVAVVAALEAFRQPTAADLIDQVKPQILAEWRKNPALRDASIQNLTLAHQVGDTYAGTVDATIAGRPQKFALKVVTAGATFDWQVEAVAPDYGTLLEFGVHQLYFTPGVTEAEAKRLGDFLLESGFFAGPSKTVQLAKSEATYRVRFPVAEGFDRLPNAAAPFEQFAAELSKAVFDSAPTEIHLCNDRLVTLRVVTQK